MIARSFKVQWNSSTRRKYQLSDFEERTEFFRFFNLSRGCRVGRDKGE
jgi:hypothetical protein